MPTHRKKEKKAGAPDLLGKLPGRLMASDPRPCSAISISVALSWQLGLVKKAAPCLSDAGDSSIQNDRVRLRRKTPPISRPTPARHVHGDVAPTLLRQLFSVGDRNALLGPVVPLAD